MRREIRKFQDRCNGNDTFDDLEQTNDASLLIVNECATHVLVFDQREDENNKVTRVFSCRRVANDGIKVLTCLVSIIRITSLDDKIPYLSHHICQIPIEQTYTLSLMIMLNPLLGC